MEGFKPDGKGGLYASSSHVEPMAIQPTLEQRIAAIPAAKVTMEDIEAEIVSEDCFTAEEGLNGRDGPRHHGSPLALLTICVLTLRNGFTVVGTSACADPAQFNAQIGRELARRDAVRQVWPLMGFALRNELSGCRPMQTGHVPQQLPLQDSNG